MAEGVQYPTQNEIEDHGDPAKLVPAEPAQTEVPATEGEGILHEVEGIAQELVHDVEGLVHHDGPDAA